MVGGGPMLRSCGTVWRSSGPKVTGPIGLFAIKSIRDRQPCICTQTNAAVSAGGAGRGDGPGQGDRGGKKTLFIIQAHHFMYTMSCIRMDGCCICISHGFYFNLIARAHGRYANRHIIPNISHTPGLRIPHRRHRRHRPPRARRPPRLRERPAPRARNRLFKLPANTPLPIPDRARGRPVPHPPLRCALATPAPALRGRETQVCTFHFVSVESVWRLVFMCLPCTRRS